MAPIEFSTAEREAFQSWRCHHPHPRVQRKREALDLKSQGVSAAEACRLCGISQATWFRYLRAYRSGGIDNLKTVPLSSPVQSVGGLPRPH